MNTPHAQGTPSTFVVNIIELSFVPSIPWRFGIGTNHFSACIDDQDFWNAINRRDITFAAGDQLEVTLTSFPSPNRISRVVRHISSTGTPIRSEGPHEQL